MKRALLSEMTHEWRNNIWLVVELAVVSLAIWAVMMMLWVECKGLFKPRGFSPEDVYTIEVKSIPETSPYFLEEYRDNYCEDRNELLRRIRENPHVLAASLHNNFTPYEYNYAGNWFKIEGRPDSVGYGGNIRVGEPDIIKVLDIKSLTGKSAEELAAMLAKGEILISSNDIWEENHESVRSLIGESFYFDFNPEVKWKVGDVVQKVKRSDYEFHPSGVVIMPYSNINKEWGNIILKLKPGKAEEFRYEFENDPSLSKLRNVYLSNLTSLVEKGKSLHREIEINIRLMVAVSFFLLVTVFLGLIGSFWFRVQQRISEIAIRKTFGATNFSLFRRINGEGLILLLVALMAVSVCVWPFISKLSDFLGEEWYSFLAMQGITAGVMAMCIICSLWYPAYKAMHIEPAVAVKEE